MSSLLEMVTQQLGGQTLQQMSSQLGTDPQSTQKALAAALPMLVGGLSRNTQSQDGAASLASALDRDHDGSILNDLAGMLGGSGSSSGLGGLLEMAGSMLGGGSAPRNKTFDGDGILGHILGNKRGAVEQGVSRSSGLDVGKTSKLLAMLAPIVMGALGKMKQKQNLDAGGLSNVLKNERAAIEQRTSGMQQGGLASILDMDGDGDIADDVAKIGSALGASGILGQLFGNK